MSDIPYATEPSCQRCGYQLEFCRCVDASVVVAHDKAWARLVKATGEEVWMRDHGGVGQWDSAEAERQAASQALRGLGVPVDELLGEP